MPGFNNVRIVASHDVTLRADKELAVETLLANDGRFTAIPDLSSQCAVSNAEQFLSFLAVDVDAFAVCEIGPGHALAVQPNDAVVVHFVLSGRGAILWGHERQELEPGSVAIAPRGLAKQLAGPGDVTKIISADCVCTTGNGLLRFTTAQASDSLRLACATVSANVGRGLGLFDQLQTPLVRAGGSKLSTLFAWMLEESASSDLGAKALIDTYMKQVLVSIIRQLSQESGSRDFVSSGIVNNGVARIVNSILADPARNHSLTKLARMAGMSSACLNQKFKSLVGLTACEYVQKIRLDAACNILLTTELPIKSIAAAVGFASRSHFSREFARVIGCDPTSFRRSAAGDSPRAKALANEPELIRFSLAV